jgi:hypothetical protein
VPRGAERDPLRGNRRIRVPVVVGREECVEINEVLGQRRRAGARMDGHLKILPASVATTAPEP